MNKGDYALELKHNGYNCCQSVVCAFADEVGIPAEELKRFGTGFGAGMGNTEGNCGALCGAEMLVGLAPERKAPAMKAAAAIQSGFTARCGSSVCKEIKGRETGKVLCSCDDCVRNAALIAEEVLFR